MKMNPLIIDSRREFFWDNYIIDTAKTTAEFKQHKPVFEGVAFEADNLWEEGMGYFTILKDENLYRMWHGSHVIWFDKTYEPSSLVCYAESRDGINWTKPALGQKSIEGCFDNNIVLGSKEGKSDNFFVFKDEHGLPEERYKGIGACAVKGDMNHLCCWVSEDGFNFKKKYLLGTHGAYDSMNTAFWDKEKETYVCYFRGYHCFDENGNFVERSKTGDDGTVRDIRVIYSKNFEAWSEDKLLEYCDVDGNSLEEYPLYTNNVCPYYRGEHISLGFPVRYVSNLLWTDNFDRLCGKEERLKRIKRSTPRGGLALTDCILMLSRDGEKFVRYDNAFMDGGPENSQNWVYGDCYLNYGYVETKDRVKGADNRLSIYSKRGHGWGKAKLDRYSLRIDGYISMRAPYKGAKIVTKPFVFSGDTLEANFATSARGFVDIKISDEEGNYISSGIIKGDKVDKVISFDGEIENFSGKTVVMEIDMKDADIYSFRFFRGEQEETK